MAIQLFLIEFSPLDDALLQRTHKLMVVVPKCFIRIQYLQRLDSFTGVCLFGLDKSHTWGQNIGKKIWSIVIEKNGIENPDKNLAESFQKLIPWGTEYAQDGSFINMATSAGYGRAINYIDFVMYAVPTLLTEALELQFENLKAKRAK
ncbi:hypothetical protein INT48_005778 [Thamnidium elegans]|uniref:Uncharacterized protein n=1 Tax=Thamnidium elegans TaxID=101142 RepID=A0A8H7SVZ9_9FUNG|nr:hypothetical protein INT48_005778 [Thamnidium elegans]